MRHFCSKISHTYHKYDCLPVKSEEMHVVALLVKSNTAIAATQRNKRHAGILYFSRMAQQRGFRQKNCCRALPNLENAFPCDSSNVQQSCSGVKRLKLETVVYTMLMQARRSERMNVM